MYFLEHSFSYINIKTRNSYFKLLSKIENQI